MNDREELDRATAPGGAGAAAEAWHLWCETLEAARPCVDAAQLAQGLQRRLARSRRRRHALLAVATGMLALAGGAWLSGGVGRDSARREAAQAAAPVGPWHDELAADLAAARSELERVARGWRQRSVLSELAQERADWLEVDLLAANL